jgi:DNA-binding CsgD family transcriptional regulator
LEEDYLAHYGTKRHSGRYPWGSGEDPYQHEGGIHGAVKDLRDKGMSDADIAKGWNISQNELKTRLSAEKTLKRAASYEEALRLQASGMSTTDIGRRLGINESSVRSLLDASRNKRNQEAIQTRDMLKDEVDKYGATDIGKGVSNRLGVTDTKFSTAVFMLQSQGYHVHNIKVRQGLNGNQTTVQVIAPPTKNEEERKKQWSDLVHNPDKIHIINDPYTEDGGKTWEHIETPRSVSSKRVYVRYAEDGGKDKDGLIEIRPNVEDLDMGSNQYAQVRIAVDGTHYMKGMCVYNPNFPKEAEGYDIIYNSNKHKGAAFDKVFKPLKDNPDNPFGSLIKADEYDDEGNFVREVGQRHYIDKNGKKQLSAINIVNEQGDWSNWKKRLASQFISKQSPELAERQLKLAYDKKAREFEEIKALTNTAVQQKLLESFASDCDASAVHLKAAPLPGQRSHVIIPFPNMKDDEVYAPNYSDGEIVSLIRFPHEGRYEIPTLRVNNRNREARKILGNAPDAIGINMNVANTLSGADFDGDSVLVIPNPDGKLIKNDTSPIFKELREFDTKETYGRDAFPEGQNNWLKVGPRKKKEFDKDGNEIKHDGFDTQMQMGIISNLITDMTLKKAPPEELIRATKHAMVIIDAEKHDLNWKQSEIDNNIKELKMKYQKKPDGKYGGASTLISRAKSKQMVPERKDFYRNMINPETGEIEWKYTGATQRKQDPKTGEWYQSDKLKLQESKKMAEARTPEEVYALSSGTVMEAKYADYAIKMKLLGNEARKYMVSLPNMKTNAEAKKEYETEVKSILAKLNAVHKHRPLERKARAIADTRLKILQDEHPEMTYDEKKKHYSLLLSEARQRMGAEQYKIKLTPREWEAIQQGAVAHTTFQEVLNNTDLDRIKEYATPRDFTPKLSRTEINYAKTLLNTMTQGEVADILGVSVSTLERALK